MQILEQSITRPYWEWTYKIITRRHQQGPNRFVGKRGVVQLPCCGLGFRVYYAIFRETSKGPRPMAWLMLKQRPGWTAWEVEQLWIFPAFRGQGLAKDLYRAVINDDGMLVASGKTHTKHSKALWESFVRRDFFTIWAHDFKNLSIRCPVYWDDGELYSRHRLYGGKGDIRLVATTKRTA